MTQKQWEHIINHPEIEDYEESLKDTIRKGNRRQYPIEPNKYRSTHFLNDLSDDMNCMEAIVIFEFDAQDKPNNWIATAYCKHIRRK